jgi:hypothetical protein
MLVDLARHVSNAYSRQGHVRDEVLDRIYRAFDAERAFPTDDAEQIDGQDR